MIPLLILGVKAKEVKALVSVKDYMSGKYSKDYTECPNCNGYGSSLKEGGNTCSRCGGSGLVKRE